VLAAALGLLLLAGCGPQPVRELPNVLLITLDTTRADFFGAYGSPGRGTPYFDAVARRGALFQTAISTASVTPVAHASILTGLEPYHHGLRVLFAESGFRLPADIPTLATVLHARGWRTGAVHSAFPVSPYFGLDQGFTSLESFDARFQEGDGKHRWEVARYQRRSDDATDLALEFVDQGEDPFFLWVHYWDPHDAELLPPPELLSGVPDDRSRRNRKLYAAEVEYLDSQFGRLLEGLEERSRYDETLLVVTADHGEGLGDHGWGVHRLLYQEQIRIPLIFRIPGQAAGAPLGELARVTDIYPTLLDYLGIEDTAGVDGRSLRTLLTREAEPPRLAYADQLNGYDLNSKIGSRRPFDDFLYCVMDAEWKLIYRPEFPERSELFHLKNDPGETTNLYAREPEQRLRLQRELARRDAWISRPFAAGLGASPDEAAAAREALESLGYTGSERSGGGEESWGWTCPRHADVLTNENESCPHCAEPLILRARP
jgi:arylsulfatase A-like enzyme